MKNNEIKDYLQNKNNENNEKVNSLHSFLNNLLSQVNSGSKNAIKKAQTWIEEKGESAKNFLKSAKGETAKKALKTFSALALASTIMLSTTSCCVVKKVVDKQKADYEALYGQTEPVYKDPYFDPSYDQNVDETIDLLDPVTDPITQPPYTNPPVTNPPVTCPPVTCPPATNPPVTNPPVTDAPTTEAPIQISAEEVLSAYDALAQKIQGLQSFGNASTSTQFFSISPAYVSTSIDAEQRDYAPFYYSVDEYDACHSWLMDPSSPYFNGNIETLEDITTVSFNFTRKNNNVYTIQNMGISNEAIAQVLETFGVIKRPVTSTDATSSQNFQNITANYIGQNLYEGFVIDRETILHATPEQLLALSDMLTSINNINFYNLNPESQSHNLG